MAPAGLVRLLVEQTEEGARGEDGDALILTCVQHAFVAADEIGRVASNGRREDEIVLLIVTNTMDGIDREDQTSLAPEQCECVVYLSEDVSTAEIWLRPGACRPLENVLGKH